jgi:hypothetical protein
MLRRVASETFIDDPALIEKVAIAIFEKTQGNWEYAREADREWARLEAQAAIEVVLKHIEERDRIFTACDSKQQPPSELILQRQVGPPGRYSFETLIKRQLPLVGNNPFLVEQSVPAGGCQRR